MLDQFWYLHGLLRESGYRYGMLRQCDLVLNGSGFLRDKFALLENGETECRSNKEAKRCRDCSTKTLWWVTESNPHIHTGSPLSEDLTNWRQYTSLRSSLMLSC